MGKYPENIVELGLLQKADIAYGGYDLLQKSDAEDTLYYDPTRYRVYPYQQRGDGVMSALRGLWRIFQPIWSSSIKPAAKSALKAVGKQALATAGGYVGDLTSGANWKEAAEDRFREASAALGDKLSDKLAKMSGMGYGYGYGGGYGQLGGAANKALHNAVKLYSFAPPAAARGRTYRKRKFSAQANAPRRRRRRQPKRKAGVKRKRRKKTARKGPQRKRKTGARKRKIRRNRQQQQRGGDYLF